MKQALKRRIPNVVWNVFRKGKGVVVNVPRRLKTLCRFLRLHSKSQSAACEVSASNTAIVVLRNGGIWKRFYHPLLFMLSSNGYQVRLVFNSNFFTTRNEPVDDLLFSRIPLKIAWNIPATDRALLVTDVPTTEWSWRLKACSRKARRTLILRAGYESRPPTDLEIDLPFPMHPVVYGPDYEEYAGMRPEPSAERDILCFFAGNMDPQLYDDRIALNGKYGVHTRRQILEQILDSQPPEQIVHVRTWDEKNALEGDLKDKIVLVDSFKAGLTKPEYFGLLARSRFFIATPGITKPWAHNLTEALFMAAVPLIQFPERISHRMVHNENCLRFDDLASLVNLLEYCRAMDADERADLTRSAGLLYRDQFDPGAVVGMLANWRGRGSVAYVNIKYR